MAGNNPKVNLVNINGYTKFNEILFIGSQIIEQGKKLGGNNGTMEWGTNQIQYSPHFFKVEL